MKKPITQEQADAVRLKRMYHAADQLLVEASGRVDKGEDEDIQQAALMAAAAIRLRPEDPRAAFVLAHCHMKAARPETAYFLYRYCQKFKEYDGPHLWNSIGMALCEMQRWDDAERWYLKSLAAKPSAHTYSSLASIYTKKANPTKGVEMCEKALELDPDSDEAKWNGSLALLKLRAWKRGWAWYDCLIGSKLRPKPPSIVNGEDISIWDGQGGNVLIQGEQGLGDEIMFSSMIPDALARADKVILAVEPRLINLFQRSFPEAVVISRKEKTFTLPYEINITHSINIGSLGQFFRLKDSDFPGVPYLIPDPERCVMYRALLDSLGGGKKVGLMWRGGVGGLDANERAINLVDMEEFIATEGIHWVSLNHLDGAGHECERFYESTGNRVHHWKHIVQSDDYDDTAALVKELDAVVCVTGTVGHMAGAVGTPAHVLTPKEPQWRYCHEGSKIPWYNSMTLYRQGVEWPLDDVLEALA